MGAFINHIRSPFKRYNARSAICLPGSSGLPNKSEALAYFRGDPLTDSIGVLPKSFTHSLIPTEPVIPTHSGSTIYVDAAATGAGDGSSWDDAYTSIQAAHNAATSGDVLEIAEGVYDENDSATFGLSLSKNIRIHGNGAVSITTSATYGIGFNSGSAGLVFSSVTIDMEGQRILRLNTTTGSVYLDSCTIEIGDISQDTIYGVSGSYVFKNTTFNVGTTGAVVFPSHDVSLTIWGCTIAVAELKGQFIYRSALSTNCVVANSTVTVEALSSTISEGLAIFSFINTPGDVVTCGNSITINDHADKSFAAIMSKHDAAGIKGAFIAAHNEITHAGQSGYGIYFGNEMTSSGDETAIAGIFNNTVTATAESNSIHSILYGFQTAGMVRGNVCVSAGYGVVSKGSGQDAGVISFNSFADCTRGVYVKGNTSPVIINNSFYGITAAAINITDYLAGVPENVKIKNNAYSVAGSAIFVDMTWATSVVGLEIDYNIGTVENASSLFGNIDSTYYNFTAWQAAGYDTNGDNIDPLFSAPSANDFSLLSNSPCVGAGSDPFADGDGDQYDGSNYQVWNDTFDAPVYHARDGWPVGSFVGSGKVKNNPVLISGSGLTGTYTLPICPTLLDADQGNTIYTASYVPQQIDLSTYVDTDWMRVGDAGWPVYSASQDAETITKIDRYIRNT